MALTRSPLAIFPPLLLLVFFTGCGKDITTTITLPPPSTSGTGNWFISGYYEKQDGAILPYTFGGSLLNSGGHISGVFHVNQPCFASGETDVLYTGTLDGKNNLSITSSPVAGQVLTFHGILSSDGSTVTDGSFTVTGGCTGNIVSGTFNPGPGIQQTTAIRIPALDGSWSTQATVPGLAMTQHLTQSPDPNSHGDYVLTGSVSITGLPCSTHGTLQAGSFISGYFGHESILLSDGSTLDTVLQLNYKSIDQTKPAFILSPAIITGGNCNQSVDLELY